MARTKASVGAKVAFGKSSKAEKSCAAIPSTSSGKTKSSSRSSSSGGNPYCPRETPNWQLPITRFFSGASQNSDDEEESSGSSRLRTSDKPDESVDCEELNNTASSEVELLPIVDDGKSHKIGDFFSVANPSSKDDQTVGKLKNKGKGKGKNRTSEVSKSLSSDESSDSKDKENVLPESTEKVLINSTKKRAQEDCATDLDVNNSPKKIKLGVA